MSDAVDDVDPIPKPSELFTAISLIERGLPLETNVEQALGLAHALRRFRRTVRHEEARQPHRQVHIDTFFDKRTRENR